MLFLELLINVSFLVLEPLCVFQTSYKEHWRAGLSRGARLWGGSMILNAVAACFSIPVNTTRDREQTKRCGIGWKLLDPTIDSIGSLPSPFTAQMIKPTPLPLELLTEPEVSEVARLSY